LSRPADRRGQLPPGAGRRARVRPLGPDGTARDMVARADGTGRERPGGRPGGERRGRPAPPPPPRPFGAAAPGPPPRGAAGGRRGTVVAAGRAASGWLEGVAGQLGVFEPVELREQVTSSWARETQVRTEDEMNALMEDQMPFHFREPQGAALAEYLRRTAGLA